MKYDLEPKMDDAQQGLVRKHLGMTVWALKKWPHLVRLLGEAEAQSLASLALCEAARRFNPDKGKFTTYAARYIWGYWMEWANRRGLIRTPEDSRGRFRFVPIEALDLESEPEPEREFDEAERLRKLVALLSPRQRHAVQRVVIDGVNLRVAAKEVGVTREAVRQAKEAGLNLLRKWLTREEEPCPAS